MCSTSMDDNDVDDGTLPDPELQLKLEHLLGLWLVDRAAR